MGLGSLLLLSQTLYAREDAGTQRYNVGTDTPKLWSAFMPKIRFLPALEFGDSWATPTCSGRKANVPSTLKQGGSWESTENECSTPSSITRMIFKSHFERTDETSRSCRCFTRHLTIRSRKHNFARTVSNHNRAGTARLWFDRQRSLDALRWGLIPILGEGSKDRLPNHQCAS
jgi:hypothetical protein